MKRTKMTFSEQLEKDIRAIPDFPKPGILFRDITTLLNNAQAFARVLDYLESRYKNSDIDFIAGIESRGFIFGAALASRLCLGFVPIRKAGKLPCATFKESYELEYGSASLEIHKDAFREQKDAKVLLIDDLLATGGTAAAACKLVKNTGAKVVEACFIIELVSLSGASKLRALCDFYSILKL
ncbi:adenine phosphoribosyltransferase [Campylobacter sp.]|uniref:adenine phosphoribosyltransferase n=1 Tax=Campylobacter sp. TaxID=205 RepID=UPI0038B258F9